MVLRKRFSIIISIFLCLFAVLGLSSCGGGGSKSRTFYDMYGEYQEWLTLKDDGSYLGYPDSNSVIKIAADDSHTFLNVGYTNCKSAIALRHINAECGFGEDVITAMFQTSAIQGNQQRENENFRISWNKISGGGLYVYYYRK